MFNSNSFSKQYTPKKQSSKGQTGGNSGSKRREILLPISHTVQEIGRFIKSTVKKYTWNFSIGERQYFVTMEHTLLSGKRELFINGKFKLETQS
jgi:hypothetical protein